MRRIVLSFLLILGALGASAQNGLEWPGVSKDEIIVRHGAYSLSYNPDWMISNWVAYRLDASNLEGDAVRAGHFSPDPAPQLSGMNLAQHWHYTRSGWVRGHMAPAGDFKYSQEAMTESFYTTNVCPMNMEFNNGMWKRIEEKIRKWAVQFGTVYIVTGPVVYDNKFGRLGESGILIPDAFYKAVLIPVGDSFYSIGFILFNEPVPKGSSMRDYALTVDDIESLIHRDLFCNLKPRTARVTENQLPLKELGL